MSRLDEIEERARCASLGLWNEIVAFARYDVPYLLRVARAAERLVNCTMADDEQALAQAVKNALAGKEDGR